MENNRLEGAIVPTTEMAVEVIPEPTTKLIENLLVRDTP